MRHLGDARYRADRSRNDGEEALGLFSRFADIGDAWYNIVSSYRSDKVRVGESMVRRGRKVRLREWKELSDHDSVRFQPTTKVRGYAFYETSSPFPLTCFF